MEKQVVSGFVEDEWEEDKAWFAATVEDDTMVVAADVTVSEVGKVKEEEEDEAAVLPGFRFHPTDEELIGFYLRRKVERRPLSREIIKVVDIYKYEPWELPKVSANVGTADMEWYFYCRRGRKYRNSVRPNRVTGRGFWKATGVDKPIFSRSSGKGKNKVGDKTASCLGLKKSLVYYIGSAGKGTKTDWMMHEFRLPPIGGGKKDGSDDNQDYSSNNSNINIDQSSVPEAEVWTICRIFKRALPHKKQQPQSRGDRRPMAQAAPAQYTEYLEIHTPAQDMCGQWYSSPDSSFEVDVDDSDDGDASTTFSTAPLGQYYDDRGYAVEWFEEERQHQNQHRGQHFQYQHHYSQQQTLVSYAPGNNEHLHQQLCCLTDSSNAEAGGGLHISGPASAVLPEKGLASHGFSGAATTGSSCFVSNNDILKDWTWEDISRMVSPGP